MSTGDRVIAADIAEIESLLALIPPAYRGLRFNRLVSTLGATEVTRLLEVSFATTWYEHNRYDNRFVRLLSPGAEDQKKGSAPRTEREWEVAELVAATLIQWLATPVGTALFFQAFRAAGGEITHKLPGGL